MARTLPNLGVKVWDAPTDAYNSDQLVTNFLRIDDHDHSPGKGRPLASNSLADYAVTKLKLATEVTDDYEYAFSTYKSMLRRSAQFAAPATGSQFALGTNAASTTYATPDMLFYLDPADLSAANAQAASFGRTVKFRLRANFLVGSTAMTFTPSTALLQATGWGTGASPQVTGTALVTGSLTNPTSPPAANTQTTYLSQTEFALPGAGWYFISHAISAQSATWNIGVELQYRTV